MIGLQIIKTEFRKQLRPVLIWSVVFGLLAFIIFGLFDTIKQQAPLLQELTKSYPPELLEAFGSRLEDMAKIEGFFVSEFMSLFILVNSIYAAYLGATSLGREIGNGSIYILLTKPISRVQIMLAKLVNILALLIISNLIVIALGYLGAELLTSEPNISIPFFAACFAGGLMMQILFAVIGIVGGTIISDTQAVLLGAGLAIGGMIVDALSNLKGVPEFIKYLTPNHYLDLSNLTATGSLRTPEIWMLLLASVVLLTLGAWWFRRRDLNI